MNIPLGFEVGTGARVTIPLGHTIVLGQTQLSGKTTTLQAMTERSGVCAIAFITKRGEKSFRGAREIPPYFTETSVMQPYWKFVISMVEGVMDSKLGSRERGWVMNLCRDYELSKNVTDTKGKKKRSSTEWEEPATLRAVLENAKKALAFTRGVNELICVQLVEYLKMAVPELESAKLSSTIKLHPGINVMDLSKLSHNVQALVLRSVVEWVYTSQRRTVVIIPEAWKFLPEGRTTPVSFPVEELIRQGAALQNFVWIDLQDLRGIKKLLLRSIQVWLFGVQREKNEVANTLKSMPTPEHKPSASEMMQLGIGQFIAAYGNDLRRVYVWPAGMEETHAQAIALGHEDPKSWKRIARALDEQEKDEQEKEADSENPAGPGDAAGDGGLPGVQPVRADEVAEEDSEEIMWKEKYDSLQWQLRQALGYTDDAQASAEDVVAHVKILREAHDEMAEQIRASEAAGETVLYSVPDPEHRTMVAGFPPGSPVKLHPASNGTHDLDTVYRYVVDRAAKDPGILQVLRQQPELQVETERQTVSVKGDTLRGRLALLISKGFFEAPKNGNVTYNELKRIGASVARPNVYRELGKLAEMGFLTAEELGYQSVKSMKVNILEAK
jgi:hypothetical protein